MMDIGQDAGRPQIETMAAGLGVNQPITAKSFHKVEIMKADNGFIVQVGCKIFVADTFEKVSEGLSKYYKNPRGTEKEYCK